MAMVLGTMWRARHVMRESKPTPESAALRMLVLGLIAYLLAGTFSSIPFINVLYILLSAMGSLTVLTLEQRSGAAMRPATPATDPRRSRPVMARPVGTRGGLAAFGDA
jgi:predicted histidine transporter YuiF (NhaC family)